MKIHYNTTKGKILLHASVWFLLLLFPLLIMMYEEHDTERNLRMLKLNWLQMSQYAVIFYINYLWLIRKYFMQKKFLVFFVINLLLLALMLWFNDMIHTEVFAEPGKEFFKDKGFRPNPPPDKPGMPPFRFFWVKGLLSLLVPTIVAIAVSSVENWFRSEEAQKEASRAQLESELQNLRYQIQPHFFFNSLNNIYSLVETSAPKAQQAIHGLSRMMRYLLYETSRTTVGLDEEIRFIVSYIELMKLRQTDKTLLIYSFPEIEARHWQLAPLLFIPLIENAFKHGVSATKKSEIRFEITVSGSNLLFVGINTNYPKVDSDKSGSGIGLSNLRKRLELLYPGQNSLSTTVENEMFVATLQLRLTAAEMPSENQL